MKYFSRILLAAGLMLAALWQPQTARALDYTTLQLNRAVGRTVSYAPTPTPGGPGRTVSFAPTPRASSDDA